MSELKRCPFCGDIYIRLQYHKSNGRNYYYWTIGCNTLNCVCLHTQGKMFGSKEEAIEAWNRRIIDETD